MYHVEGQRVLPSDCPLWLTREYSAQGHIAPQYSFYGSTESGDPYARVAYGEILRIVPRPKDAGKRISVKLKDAIPANCEIVNELHFDESLFEGAFRVMSSHVLYRNLKGANKYVYTGNPFSDKLRVLVKSCGEVPWVIHVNVCSTFQIMDGVRALYRLLKANPKVEFVFNQDNKQHESAFKRALQYVSVEIQEERAKEEAEAKLLKQEQPQEIKEDAREARESKRLQLLRDLFDAAAGVTTENS